MLLNEILEDFAEDCIGITTYPDGSFYRDDLEKLIKKYVIKIYKLP